MKNQRIYNILEGSHRHYRNSSFEWGKLDCCLWVANILKAIHGVDYANKYRGQYDSIESFKRLLVINEFKSLKEMLVDAFGSTREGWEAKIGDPLLLREKEEDILGMCFGSYGLFLTEKGFTKRTNNNCIYSWRI